jgi:hypothetical protein
MFWRISDECGFARFPSFIFEEITTREEPTGKQTTNEQNGSSSTSQ